jgi:hypothetical protein
MCRIANSLNMTIRLELKENKWVQRINQFLM